MQFSAYIRPHSTVDKAWRARRQRSGTVSGVVFALTGKHFSAEGLNADQIAELENIPSVQIECLSVAPVSPDDVEELLCAKRGRGRPRKDASAE